LGATNERVAPVSNTAALDIALEAGTAERESVMVRDGSVE
jgi:hypothetical protein